jgi:hypothetical protein
MANRYNIWTFVDAPPQTITGFSVDTSVVSEVYWGDGTLDTLNPTTTTLSHTYAGLNYLEGHTESSSNNYLDRNYIRGSLQEFNELI